MEEKTANALTSGVNPSLSEGSGVSFISIGMKEEITNPTTG